MYVRIGAYNPIYVCRIAGLVGNLRAVFQNWPIMNVSEHPVVAPTQAI